MENETPPQVAPPAPVAPTIPKPEPNSPRLPFSKVLLAVVLLAAAGFAIFYAGIYINLNKEVTKETNIGRSTSETVTTISSIMKSTASWKLYSNSRFDYKLMYPSYMTHVFQEDINKNISGAPSGSKDLSLDSYFSGEKLACCGYAGPNFTIDIHPQFNEPIPTPSLQRVNVGGIQANVSFYKLTGIIVGPIKHNNATYKFTYSIYGKDLNEIPKDFSRILSSFTFLNQSDITVSPTCRPRPACLDTTPRCMIAETSDMCPPATPSVQRACPQYAMKCPDGSYVSPSGSDCKVPACPGAK